MRGEINEIENRKTIDKINKIEINFWKIDKIDKILARLTKNKREYSNKIRNERGDIATDPTKTQRL